MRALDQVISPEKFEEFLELGKGSPSFLVRILNVYIENFKKLTTLCWQHYKKGDRKSLKFEIHTLKGSSLNIGFNFIAEFLINLEDRLSGLSAGELKEALEELESYTKILEKYKNHVETSSS